MGQQLRVRTKRKRRQGWIKRQKAKAHAMKKDSAPAKAEAKA